MSGKNIAEAIASLAGAVGIGAGIMYLFDPDRGEARRERLAERAERAWEATGATLGATGEALEETWDEFSDKARGWGKQISRQAKDRAAHLRDQAGDWMDDSADQARGYGRQAARGLRGYANRASRYAGNRARAMMPYTMERHHSGTAVSVAAGVVGALALGAGLMYIFDPNQGRHRREVVRDKAKQYTDQATHAVREGAQQATDYARTAVHQAQEAVKQKTGAGAEPQTSQSM